MLCREYSYKRKKFRTKKLQNGVFKRKFCMEQNYEDDRKHHLQLNPADCTLDVLIDHSTVKSSTSRCKFLRKRKLKEIPDGKYKSSKIHLGDKASENVSSKRSKQQVKGLKKRKTLQVISSEEINTFYRHLLYKRHLRFESIMEKYENWDKQSDIVDILNFKKKTARGKWVPLRVEDFNAAPYVDDEETTEYMKMIWERCRSDARKNKQKKNHHISFTKEEMKNSNFLYNSNEPKDPFFSKDFTPKKSSNLHPKEKPMLNIPSKFEDLLYEHNPHLNSTFSDYDFDNTLPCLSVRASSQQFNLKTTDLDEGKHLKGSNNYSFTKKGTLSIPSHFPKDHKEVLNRSGDALSKSPQQSLSPCFTQNFRSKSGRQVSLLSFSSVSFKSGIDQLESQFSFNESAVLKDQNSSSGDGVSNKSPEKSKKSKNELAYKVSKDACRDAVATVTSKKDFRYSKDKKKPQYDSDESSESYFVMEPNSSYGKSVSYKSIGKSKKSKNELAYKVSKDVCHDAVATVTSKKGFRSGRDKKKPQYDSDESSCFVNPNNSYGKGVLNKSPAKSKKSINEPASHLLKDVCHDAIATVTSKKGFRSGRDKKKPQYDSDESSCFANPNNSYGKSVLNKSPAKSKKSINEPASHLLKDVCHDAIATVTSKKDFRFSKYQKNPQYDSDESSFLMHQNKSYGESVSNKSPSKSKNKLAYKVSEDVYHDVVATVTSKKDLRSGRDKKKPLYDSDESSFLMHQSNSYIESVSNKSPSKSKKSKNELAYKVSKDVWHDAVATVTSKKDLRYGKVKKKLQYDSDESSCFVYPNNSYGKSVLNKSPAKSKKSINEPASHLLKDECHDAVATVTSKKDLRSSRDKKELHYDSDESSFLANLDNSYGKSGLNKSPSKSKKHKQELAYQVSKDLTLCLTPKNHRSMKQHFFESKNSNAISSNKNRYLEIDSVENNPVTVPRSKRIVRKMSPERSCLKNDSKVRNHTKKKILEKGTLLQESSSKNKFEAYVPHLRQSKSRSLRSFGTKINASTDGSMQTQNISDPLSKQTKVSCAETNSLKFFESSFESPLFPKLKECYVRLEKFSFPSKSTKKSFQATENHLTYNFDDSEGTQNISDHLSKVSRDETNLLKPFEGSFASPLFPKLKECYVRLEKFSFSAKSSKKSFQTTENHLTVNSPNSSNSTLAFNSSSNNNCSLKDRSHKNKPCEANDSNKRQSKKRKIDSTEIAVVQKPKRTNANKSILQQFDDQPCDSKAYKFLDKKHFKHTASLQEPALSEQRTFWKDSKGVKAVGSPSERPLDTLTSFWPESDNNSKNKAIHSKRSNLKESSIKFGKLSVSSQFSTTENLQHVSADSATTMLPKELGSFKDKYNSSTKVRKGLNKPSNELRRIQIYYQRYYKTSVCRLTSTPKSSSSKLKQ